MLRLFGRLRVLTRPIPLHTRIDVPDTGYYLRPPERQDWQSWADVRTKSRAFLTPWEPTWPRGSLTRTAYRRWLAVVRAEMRTGQSAMFFLVEADSGDVAGGINLRPIRRGVAQSAQLGYWIGQAYAARGIMSRAVGAICAFAFEDLKLHRLEAACLAANAPSRGVLAHNGFSLEGKARGYLKINGVWEDHLLFARLNPTYENASATTGA